MPLPPEDTHQIYQSSPILDSDRRALQRLVSGAVPQDELASLIEGIVLNVKSAAFVECLRGSDARAFIEVMDKVWMTSSVPGRLLHGWSFVFPGPRYPRFRTANPQQVREVVVQDVCWSFYASRVAGFLFLASFSRCIQEYNPARRWTPIIFPSRYLYTQTEKLYHLPSPSFSIVLIFLFCFRLRNGMCNCTVGTLCLFARGRFKLYFPLAQLNPVIDPLFLCF